nr:glucose-6-phosphate dehydrogenase [Acidobacteriota bacterium]
MIALEEKAQEQQQEEINGRPAPRCVMVIFGAAGDLTSRKLIPALYNLGKTGLLPKEFAVIGFALDALTEDEFRDKVRKDIIEAVPAPVDEALCAWLMARIYYMAADFRDAGAYEKLKGTLAEVDAKHGTHGNYFYYLATAPQFFAEIVKQLGAQDLQCEEEGRWRRVIIEKPFGSDLASARTLNIDIRKVLNEKQIYRIDHYLGKETVQNILVFRFSNGIFEPIWNRRYI